MNRLTLAVFACLCWFASSLNAGDWPTWRFDAQRGASTPHSLPNELSLRWVRQLEPSRTAWPPTQSKLQFDKVPEPIVAGHIVYVPSNVTDTVTAYDTRSGEELWRFYADGPVRFAPVYDQGRVFFVSDDGFLYALNAQTGERLWSFNGGPTRRSVLGNGRLVSSWPARGGPVVHRGKVFFAASIWPFMGVFIHCLDPETGEVVWTNSGDGSNFVIHPHNAPSFGTVVPQGHMAAEGDQLVVPGGRSTPAVYDTASGALRHFAFDKRIGSHAVSVRGGTYFVGGSTYDLETGDPVTKGMPVVADDQSLLFIASNRVLATSVQGETQTLTEKDPRGKDVKKKVFKRTEQFNCSLEKPPGQVYIRAGDRLYCGGNGKVSAYALPKGGAPVWTGSVRGTVVTMMAADQRLFVVDDQCRLYCFGTGEDEVIKHELLHQADLAKSSTDFVARIGSSIREQGGYAISLGIGSGDLIDRVLADTSLQVVVIDPDVRRVDKFRRRMTAAGLYGRRVAAHFGDVATYPLPQYMADLVFSETAAKVPPGSDVLQRLYATLRPYGGMIALQIDDDAHQKMQTLLADIDLQGAVVSRADGITRLTRAGALQGADDWTHQYGDAKQSVVSRDRLVKAPLGLLWFGGTSHAGILPRHGHGPSPQVAGGRLFIEGPDLLRAVDVYTGRQLWEAQLPGIGKYYDNTAHHPGAGEIGSNYVSLADHVYVVYGSEILQLDSRTGEKQRSFRLKADASQPAADWGFIAVSGDYLISTSAPLDVAVEKASAKTRRPPSDFKVAINRGAVWKYLAGTDPSGEWFAHAFRDAAWKKGKAGFGYGDGDDATTLDMRNKYGRVYIRHAFDGTRLKQGVERLGLMINYDDGFVAYLNGREIVRRGVRGDGAKAQVSSHEASGHEFIEIENGAKLLRQGKNVLAIVGHNTSIGSSDFSLDPYLVFAAKTAARPRQTTAADANANQRTLPRRLPPATHGAGSRRLVVFNRKTGEKLWHRDAVFNFRHNNIAVSKDRVFCIDRLTESRMSALERRGLKVDGTPVLYALDLKTGDVIWQNTEHVFGTFVNYSDQHDMVIQAGSRYRDRARDEVGMGIVAFRGQDGEVVWAKRDFQHGGPCMLWKDRIITNGGGGVALEIATGAPTGWSYSRHYGCNTAIGSEHLLTFRSGAAGFCDLLNDSGTANLGGFRSSCTSNLIVANGVLSAPDYTRTCTCAYQNQTSLALVHMPEAEYWSFGSTISDGRFGLNLGAPGDRRDDSGTLWLDVPSVGGQSQKVTVRFTPERPSLFRHHASMAQTATLPWVATSGVEGLETLTVETDDAEVCDVRLFFLEPGRIDAGQRVFDVVVQGKVVLQQFDVVTAAGGIHREVTRSFQVEPVGGKIVIELKGSTKLAPILSGVEVIKRHDTASQ